MAAMGLEKSDREVQVSKRNPVERQASVAYEPCGLSTACVYVNLVSQCRTITIKRLFLRV